MFVMINLVKFGIISLIGELWGNFWTILAKIRPKSQKYIKTIFTGKRKQINFPSTQRVEIPYTYYKIGLLKTFISVFLYFHLFPLQGVRNEKFGHFWAFLGHFRLFSALASAFGPKIQNFKKLKITIVEDKFCIRYT